MWKRKLIIAGACALAGVSAGAVKGYTPHIGALRTPSAPAEAEGAAYRELVRENLARLIKSRQGLSVDPAQVRVAELSADESLIGRPFVAFFSATSPERPAAARDLYMMQAVMGANALPISSTPPRNITENPTSQDRLFDVLDPREGGAVRALYGQIREDGSCRSITQLEWGGAREAQGATLITQLKQAKQYDRWEEPRWVTLRFKDPLPHCGARFAQGGSGFVAQSESTDFFKVDLNALSVSPSGAGVELISTPRERPNAIEGAQDLLLRYGLITEEEHLALTGARAQLAHVLTKNLYELLVDQSDPRQHRPIGEVSSMSDGRRPHWYPPKIDVRGGLKGEGEWRAVQVGEERSPMILKTFIRLDELHPYRSIQLYAFDTRRLGLHFVGGADPARLALEGVGSGRVRAAHAQELVAAFNGGPDPDGSQGIVQEGQALAPARLGLSSVALDSRGRALLGRLDTPALPRPWQSLRQSFAPLIDPRVVNKGFTPPQSPFGRLDAERLPRSALGVTAQGTLVYAWAEAATVEQVSLALRRVGVVFALSLKSDSSQTGLALYPPSAPARPASPKMDLNPSLWRDGSDLDFFYLVRAQSLPPALPARQPSWPAGEGEWRPVPHQDVDPLLATSFLSADKAGDEVLLTRLDGDRLQLNLALGLGRPGGDQERPLPTAPAARLPVGRLSSTLGLKALGRLLSPPVEGAMTWASGLNGKGRLGLWGAPPLTEQKDWLDIAQGVALLVGGRPAERAPSRVEGAAVAMGALPDGDIVFATQARGDLRALTRALTAAGVTDAMLLTAEPTAEAGTLQAFYEYQGRTFYALPPHDALRPALLGTEQSALVGVSDSFILTQRASAQRARFVETFKQLGE